MVSVRIGAGANLTESQMEAVQEAKAEAQASREALNGLDDRFNAKADKTELESVNELLAEKAKQIDLETTNNNVTATNTRIDTLVINSGNANAEVTDAHVSTAKNKTFTTVRNRFEEIESGLLLPYVNIITNGNFGNGTTGWTASNSILSATNNTLSVTGNGGNASVAALQSLTNGHLAIGKKYYLKFKVRVTNAVCSVISYHNGSGFIPVKNAPVQNQWYDISVVFTPTVQYSALLLRHAYADATTANGKVMEIQNVLVVCLTDTFGAGKELVQSDMDSLVSNISGNWWDGALQNNAFAKALFGKIQENNTQIKNDLQSNMNLVLKPIGNTVTKDFAAYLGVANTKIYIPNITLAYGNLKVHFYGAKVETGYFYLLEKSGTSFIVKKAVSKALIQGENVVDMDYTCKGDGTEYLGYYASSYYKTSGGTGMYEIGGAIYSEGNSFTPTDTTSGAGSTYEFSIYYEYTRPAVNLEERIVELEGGVAPPPSNEPSLLLTDYAMPKYKEITDSVGYVGRWWDKSVSGTVYKATNNQGSQIFFKVSGATSVTVGIQPITSQNNPYYYAYSIDGGAFTRKVITDGVIPLPDTKEHIVRVIIDGMGENDPVAGGKWLGTLGVYFTGLSVGAGTAKGILPVNRKGVFIGDSITEGINVLTTGAIGASNSASGAYPMICAKELNAVPYYIGYGGTGVLANASFHKAIEAIDYFYNGVPSDNPDVDFIVMAHGFNDNNLINNGTYTADQFKTAYNEVLDRLKVKFSGVPIICVVPFGAQAIQPHIESCIAGRSYCYLVKSAGWTITTTDNVHPDVNGSITLGKNIANGIRSIFGKRFFMN